jgi:hypothetical protein
MIHENEIKLVGVIVVSYILFEQIAVDNGVVYIVQQHVRRA